MSLDEHDARASETIAPSKDDTKPRKRRPLSTRPNSYFVPFAMDMMAAVHYCSVGTTVLYNAIAEKKLKLRKLGGKSIFFREDLEDWLRNEAHESPPIPKRKAAAPADKPAEVA